VRPATELQTLQLQVESTSKSVWILYGVLTAASGLAVLIINNPGFGVPLDFIFLFFWGFGIATTIGALAPGSTASALNISIAKAETVKCLREGTRATGDQGADLITKKNGRTIGRPRCNEVESRLSNI
jgi:hypothetical protein